jgi:8-hydroxy-5-deazaflavin:NADPH oxidoreductase
VDIAIIGTGSVGSALARRFTTAGHQVYLAGRTAEAVESVATETGASPAANPTAAAALASVVVLAVPFGAVEDIARAIRPVVNGKTIVDVTNPAREDWSGPLFGGNDSGAERIAAWLPEARVVKAFNTVFAGNLSGEPVDGIELDGYVAADDSAAKAEVLALVADAGLQPVDVGPTSAARQLEQLAWLNISLNMRPGATWHSGWKLVGALVAQPAELDRAA